jgi:hypothetical protein
MSDNQILMNRIKDTNENVQFLSATLTGLIKKVQGLEKTLEQQEKTNEELQYAVVLVAGELEMISVVGVGVGCERQ